MREVGKKIKNHGFIPNCIYTSVLIRAVESSKEIAKSFPGIKIVEEENLQDPYAPGIETRTNSIQGIRFTANTIDNHFIDYAHIYRIT